MISVAVLVVIYLVRWPMDHTPKESMGPLSVVDLCQGHIQITSVCGLVGEPGEQ